MFPLPKKVSITSELSCRSNTLTCFCVEKLFPLFHLNRFYDTLHQNANFYGKDPGTGRSYAAL
jgi:hypothetical protein